MNLDPVLVRKIEVFLYYEARLLDERRFEDWMALFAEDGIYWIPANPDQEDPLGEVSIAYEDRQLIDVRVRRLRHPENYADQPTVRTRRVIGNVMIVLPENGVVVARRISRLPICRATNSVFFLGNTFTRSDPSLTITKLSKNVSIC